MRNGFAFTRHRVTCDRCTSTGKAETGTVVVDRACHYVASSTFLDPFAPPALPGLNARMDPLTPERPALLTGRFRPRSQRNTARNPAHEHRHGHRSGLSASSVRPSDHSVSNHLIAPPIALTRYPSASTASYAFTYRLKLLDAVSREVWASP